MLDGAGSIAVTNPYSKERKYMWKVNFNVGHQKNMLTNLLNNEAVLLPLEASFHPSYGKHSNNSSNNNNNNSNKNPNENDFFFKELTHATKT